MYVNANANKTLSSCTHNYIIPMYYKNSLSKYPLYSIIVLHMQRLSKMIKSQKEILYTETRTKGLREK